MDTGTSSRAWQGPLLMCVASLFFAMLDTGTKYLASEYPVTQIVWARYLAQAFSLALIFVPRLGLRVLRTRHYSIQLVRGLCLCGGSVLVINGLARLPLAEATAIVFLVPVIVTILSGLLLKEKAKRVEWVAVACGFLGVLIIARPGGGLLTWAILFPIGAAVCNAFYQIVIRSSRSSEHPATSNLYTGIIGALVLSPWGATSWAPMAWFDLALLIGLGALAAIGHFTLTHALLRAPAATLGPYGYVQIFWATLMGWLVFDAAPDGWAWIGILTIAAGGLMLSSARLFRLASDLLHRHDGGRKS